MQNHVHNEGQSGERIEVHAKIKTYRMKEKKKKTVKVNRNVPGRYSSVSQVHTLKITTPLAIRDFCFQEDGKGFFL